MGEPGPAIGIMVLLVVIHGLVAVLLDQFVAFGGLQVFAHHFGDQFVEGDLRGPAEFVSFSSLRVDRLCFRRRSKVLPAGL
jgi:hypothetical protein